MADTILINIEDSIAHLIINRPDNMNCYDAQMSTELAQAVHAINSDPTTRAVVISGNGPVFMAGGDVKMFQDNLSDPQALFPPIAQALHETIITLAQMQKPIIAAVHGAVAGVGMSLMLSADIIYASVDTVFTTAYSKLGASADGGLSYVLPKVVGLQKAMELLLLAEKFSAKEALALQLINKIYPNTELTAEAKKLANKLASGPTSAYAKIRTLVRQSYDNNLPKHLYLEADYFLQAFKSGDFSRGVDAFINKSKPSFTGQ